MHRKLVELNPNVKCVQESSEAEIEGENFGQFARMFAFVMTFLSVEFLPWN
jgi:hypothetical protein